MKKNPQEKSSRNARLDCKRQSSSGSSPNSSYGSSPAEPGSNPELLRLCQEHLERLLVTADEIHQVDQSDDQSASSFGATAKQKASFTPLVISLYYSRQKLRTPAILRGNYQEPDA